MLLWYVLLHAPKFLIQGENYLQYTFISIRLIFFTECAIGYTSNSGYPCAQCSTNTYGYRCLEQCECAVEKYVYKQQLCS